jgi:hypothetical protein
VTVSPHAEGHGSFPAFALIVRYFLNLLKKGKKSA